MDEISKDEKRKIETKNIETKNLIKIIEISTKVICSYITNVSILKLEDKEKIMKEIDNIKFFEDKEEKKKGKNITYNKTEKLTGFGAML